MSSCISYVFKTLNILRHWTISVSAPVGYFYLHLRDANALDFVLWQRQGGESSLTLAFKQDGGAHVKGEFFGDLNFWKPV